MSNTHVLTRGLASAAVAGLAAGLLITAPAQATEPSKGLTAVSDTGGAGQGPSVAYQLAAALRSSAVR